MSLHRINPRRDANEPGIRSRFTFHGWHTEALSGKGMPDLLCWPRFKGAARVELRAILVDVKEPKGKPTPAQVEKWKALSEKGIPVYVARTEADVDVIVAGTAEPWGVMEARPRRNARTIRAPFRVEGNLKLGSRSAPRKVEFKDASPEAAGTFPPPMCPLPGCPNEHPCMRHGLHVLGRKP